MRAWRPTRSTSCVGNWRSRRPPQAAEHARAACSCSARPKADLAQLNRLLCERIATGEMDLDTPGLAAAPVADHAGQAGGRPARLRHATVAMPRHGRDPRHQGPLNMDFDLPAELIAYLARTRCTSSTREIAPLQAQDDNERFFDHRREWARTDFDNDGLPRHEWEALLARGAAPRRQGRPPALRAAQGIRRPGRQQPVDGGDPRAPGGQGPGPAQRSADRALDRRQQPVRADAARLRHAEQQARVHRRHARTNAARRLRPDRARARLRRHAHGNRAPCPRRATACAGWRIDGEKMWTTGMHVATPLPAVRAHQRQGRRRARHQRASSCRRKRRA